MTKKTHFRNIVGYSAETRILEALIEGRENRYSISDIQRISGIYYRDSCYKIVNMLLKERIITKNHEGYGLNNKSFIVKILIKIFDDAIKSRLKEMATQ